MLQSRGFRVNERLSSKSASLQLHRAPMKFLSSALMIVAEAVFECQTGSMIGR